MAEARALHVHAFVDSLGFGGAELLVADFARVCETAGIWLTVGALRGGWESPAARRLRAVGVEPTFVPVRSLWRRSDVRRVSEHLEAVRPDLLHTHLGYADVLGGLAARSLALPSVSTIHADWWGGSNRERVKARLMALARRRCAARVIAVSESARRIYLERRWDRPERVVVVRNSIAAQPRPGSGAALRAELGISPDEVLAAMVSRLGPEKGHDVALAAVAIARRRHTSLRLLIVGDGDLRRQIERDAAALGGAAIVTGHRDDVMQVLDAADLLLHPSRFDAFPTAVLEAMAASVPVLASDAGGIVEIVVDGETGVLVEAPPVAESVARELGRLVEDPALRQRLGDTGRERYLTEFRADAWAARTRAVYDTVLAGIP